MSTVRLGALSVIVFAVVGIAWIVLEIAPVSLGLANGDDPAVALGYLRAHPDTYVGTGSVLLLMAITLAVSVFAVSDVLAPRADSLALRSASVLGQFSAASFLMFGVVRLSTGPLLYIDSLDRDWGEAAYLVVQVVGVHGFAQAGVFALCLWAIGISLIGLRTRALPVAICLLGAIPVIRILGLLGPLGVLPDDMPDGLWIVFMVSIPGVMLWCLILGLVLLRGTMRYADRKPRRRSRIGP